VKPVAGPSGLPAAGQGPLPAIEIQEAAPRAGHKCSTCHNTRSSSKGAALACLTPLSKVAALFDSRVAGVESPLLGWSCKECADTSIQ